MFSTTVHQTLTYRNNNDEIEKTGPFPVIDFKNAFLGAGYYFWDDHYELAKWWGDVHCGGNYVICKGELEVDKSEILDLVGSRQDQINMISLMEKLNIKDMVLGKAIEYLKDINSKKPGVFPYKVIRAADNSRKKGISQFPVFFSNKKRTRGSFSILSPMYIICLIEKNDVILQSYKVLFSTR